MDEHGCLAKSPCLAGLAALPAPHSIPSASALFTSVYLFIAIEIDFSGSCFVVKNKTKQNPSVPVAFAQNRKPIKATDSPTDGHCPLSKCPVQGQENDQRGATINTLKYELGLVAHTCNPCCLGGRDWEDCSLSPA
jgi:hypothetical protein